MKHRPYLPGLVMLLSTMAACDKYEPKPVDGFSAKAQAVIFNNCVACHAGGSAENGFGVIDNPKALIEGGWVTPGDAKASMIYQKVLPNPSSGARMPFGGPYLSEKDIDALAEWIDSLNKIGTYTVSNSGRNVTVDPAAPQKISEGKTASFQVSARTGFTVSPTVGGDCPKGSWDGGKYTTGPIYGDCSVAFGATGSYTVTAYGSTRLSFTPSEPRSVGEGEAVSYDVTPAAGATLSKEVGGTCAKGTWSAATYTTGSVTDDCSVSFVVEGEATVTATAENVAVTPASSLRIVDRGSKAEFSVTANSGYVLSQTVGGDCPGGSWSGNTYTTGDVTVSCTLSFGATKTNPCPSVIANVSFANDIQPLLSQPLGDSRACTACHNPSEVGKVEFAASVSGPAVYQQLIAGRGATVGATIVEPRDPLASLLYTKTTTAPPSGEMMPQDGPTYLTDTQRSKICNWIYDGANNN